MTHANQSIKTINNTIPNKRNNAKGRSIIMSKAVGISTITHSVFFKTLANSIQLFHLGHDANEQRAFYNSFSRSLSE